MINTERGFSIKWRTLLTVFLLSLSFSSNLSADEGISLPSPYYLFSELNSKTESNSVLPIKLIRIDENGAQIKNYNGVAELSLQQTSGFGKGEFCLSLKKSSCMPLSTVQLQFSDGEATTYISSSLAGSYNLNATELIKIKGAFQRSENSAIGIEYLFFSLLDLSIEPVNETVALLCELLAIDFLVHEKGVKKELQAEIGDLLVTFNNENIEICEDESLLTCTTGGVKIATLVGGKKRLYLKSNVPTTVNITSAVYKSAITSRDGFRFVAYRYKSSPNPIQLIAGYPRPFRLEMWSSKQCGIDREYEGSKLLTSYSPFYRISAGEPLFLWAEAGEWQKVTTDKRSIQFKAGISEPLRIRYADAGKLSFALEDRTMQDDTTKATLRSLINIEVTPYKVIFCQEEQLKNKESAIQSVPIDLRLLDYPRKLYVKPIIWLPLDGSLSEHYKGRISMGNEEECNRPVTESLLSKAFSS